MVVRQMVVGQMVVGQKTCCHFSTSTVKTFLFLFGPIFSIFTFSSFLNHCRRLRREIKLGTLAINNYFFNQMVPGLNPTLSKAIKSSLSTQMLNYNF